MALREDSLALHVETDHYCIRHNAMFSVLGWMIRDVLQLTCNSACVLVAAAVAAAQQQHGEQ